MPASGVDFDDLIALPVKLLSTDAEIKRAGPPLDALPAGRRVPGHQPRPAPADPGARRPGRQPDRRRRRGPGDLPLARRRPRQHPGVREDLPRRRGAQAGAELPLDPDHPRRLRRADRQQRQPPRQAPVDRERAPAPRRSSTGRATRGTRPTWIVRHPAAPAGALQARATWRSWCAPTPRPGRSRTSCCRARSPTRWSAACGSTTAPRSRTWSPTCACCAIRATTSP